MALTNEQAKQEAIKTCNQCGEDFHSADVRKIYCSDKCRQKFKNDKRNINKGTQFIIAENHEIFKDIPDYDGLYKVSNLGNVWRCNSQVERGVHGMFISAKKLKNVIDTNGYPKVTLSKNDKKVKHYIHRLLAILFIDNPNNLPCVNHINGIKGDYSLSNLEWVSFQDNNIHAFETGLQKKGKEHHLFGKTGELCHNHKNYVK